MYSPGRLRAFSRATQRKSPTCSLRTSHCTPFLISSGNRSFLSCPNLDKTQTSWVNSRHGLSQQGVCVPFWTPKPLKRTPQDTQIFLCGISKNPNLKLIIEFFIPLQYPWHCFIMSCHILIYTCLWLKHEYIVIPLKNLDAQRFYNCQF